MAQPDGIAYFLPANCSIVLQVHYHKSGHAASDQTRIGLYFARGTPKRLQSVPILNLRFEIPAGAEGFEVRASYTVPDDIEVISILPHMHLLGKSMDVRVTTPSGETVPLISIPRYEFHWQRTYTYRTPVLLPKGSRINMIAVFDNSEKNPDNPNMPKKAVHFGEATTDEMDVAYITYVLKSQ